MNLYEMKLFDSFAQRIFGKDYIIVRVPGGWLFDDTFVPFNNEFQIDKQTYLVEGLDFPAKDGGSFSDTSINEK